MPQPIEGYISKRVLTMDYVSGTKVTRSARSSRLELERDVLADVLVRAYLKQIVIDGFFHADPHPGNVFVTDDGQLALIDLGMVGRHQPADAGAAAEAAAGDQRRPRRRSGGSAR